MKAQQRHIEELLAREGWQIVAKEQSSDCWVDEVWEIESLWSPIGARAYVSFLVDPMATGERVPGEQVWAVQVAHARPDRAMPSDAVPLRPKWANRHLAEVAERLRGLRT